MGLVPDYEDALRRDRTIDITTTGRHSGEPRRIEIWFHTVDDTVYITGLPGTRDWYANLLASPEFTFHLKESARADLAATAVPVVDQVEKRRILAEITTRLGRRHHLDAWVDRSPLVEVRFARV